MFKTKTKTTIALQADTGIIQQGDTLYFKVDALPAGLDKVKDNVIQEGEATGHAHRLQDGEIFINPTTKEKFLRITDATEVRHEEHAPVYLPPAVYLVGIIREKGMFDDLIAPVVD